METVKQIASKLVDNKENLLKDLDKLYAMKSDISNHKSKIAVTQLNQSFSEYNKDLVDPNVKTLLNTFYQDIDHTKGLDNMSDWALSDTTDLSMFVGSSIKYTDSILRMLESIGNLIMFGDKEGMNYLNKQADAENKPHLNVVPYPGDLGIDCFTKVSDDDDLLNNQSYSQLPFNISGGCPLANTTKIIFKPKSIVCHDIVPLKMVDLDVSASEGPLETVFKGYFTFNSKDIYYTE